MKKLRVAVIGGGCAAMTAAEALTRPEQNGRFEVTVYQQGWRLGGKGASGRGPHGRIEEHGLHIWMGFYENAFRLMRSVYSELARDPAVCPIADWKDAFFPSSHIGLASYGAESDWTIWSTLFPPLPGEPGAPLGPDANNPFTIPGYLARVGGMMQSLFSIAYRGESAKPAAETGWTLSDLFASAESLRHAAFGAIETALGLVENQVLTFGRLLGTSGAATPVVFGLGEALLRGLDVLRPSARSDPHRQRAGEVLEVSVAALIGILRTGVLVDPRGFDALDELDFIDWLRKNGLSDAAASGPFLLGLYSLMFGYEGGDPTRPRVAAGQALRGCLRMFFTYRGAFFWKMQAGMGDVIFAPIYEVLKKRGAKFEFFHRLTDVRAGDGHVAGLEFEVQAKSRSSEYAPLVTIRGLPSWPAEPDWEQLVDGARLEVEEHRFESFWDERHVDTRTLNVGEDFDFVVLAVGGGAVPFVAKDLVAANAQWRTMTQNCATVATQALQLWTNVPMTELGWSRGPVTMTAFVYPFDTWSDMTHLLPAEEWTAPVRGVAYFCNVLDEREIRRLGAPARDYQSRVNALVRESARTFIEGELPRLWPAFQADGRVRWETIESQFVVGNVNPTDRYVQTLPGTTKYRISPLDRTFDNLTIAGDWTNCGLSVGCVEAAVMSGLLASHALSGLPRLDAIIGYDHP